MACSAVACAFALAFAFAVALLLLLLLLLLSNAGTGGEVHKRRQSSKTWGLVVHSCPSAAEGTR
jgi:hypothetical protein